MCVKMLCLGVQVSMTATDTGYPGESTLCAYIQIQHMQYCAYCTTRPPTLGNHHGSGHIATQMQASTAPLDSTNTWESPWLWTHSNTGNAGQYCSLDTWESPWLWTHSSTGNAGHYCTTRQHQHLGITMAHIQSTRHGTTGMQNTAPLIAR